VSAGGAKRRAEGNVSSVDLCALYSAPHIRFDHRRFNDDAKAMTACGSPLWTAPEVIRGEKYSEKADIFSFSIILWELLSWSTPYKGENPHFVMMKVASQGHRLDIDESWDPFFKDLVAKCWHATPTSRPSFADITEMIMTCDKETELVKYKGDWRDTTKTFRKKKAMNRANSMRRGLGGASPSSPTRAVEVGFKVRVGREERRTGGAKRQAHISYHCN